MTNEFYDDNSQSNNGSDSQQNIDIKPYPPASTTKGFDPKKGDE
jgi:hypothetical protein